MSWDGVRLDMRAAFNAECAEDIPETSIKSNLHNIYDVMVHVDPLGNSDEDEKYGIT